MNRIRIETDPVECGRTWNQLWPQDGLFDLWPIRSAFAAAYDRKPYFIIAERKGKAAGLLALAEKDRQGNYGFYPAETWQEKTWLEQNKIPAASPDVYSDLLAAIPGPTHLRYLTGEAVRHHQAPVEVDEIGYLFFPAETGYSFSGYMERFSTKSRKKIAREIQQLQQHGVAYRIDSPADMDLLFSMNQERFGSTSYFADERFCRAFERVAQWLGQNGMLRLTTILLGGRVAAVDIGAIWNKTYTLLAGCTNPEFPGIAKMINLHHIQLACREKMQCVDFLCGDFNWKMRFHLTARPLYALSIRPEPIDYPRIQNEARLKVAHA